MKDLKDCSGKENVLKHVKDASRSSVYMEANTKCLIMSGSKAHLVFPSTDSEVTDGPGRLLLSAKVTLWRVRLSLTCTTTALLSGNTEPRTHIWEHFICQLSYRKHPFLNAYS